MAETLTIPTIREDTFLRPLRVGDAPDFQKLYRDNAHILNLYEGQPAIKMNRTVQEARDYISRDLKRGKIFGIETGDSLSGYMSIFPVGQRTFLGYWLAHQLHGQGIMPTCVDALTEWAHPTYGDIYADIDPNNRPSISVATKCGFEKVQPSFPFSRRWVKLA